MREAHKSPRPNPLAKGLSFRRRRRRECVPSCCSTELSAIDGLILAALWIRSLSNSQPEPTPRTAKLSAVRLFLLKEAKLYVLCIFGCEW
ncbi:hypothetical protein EV1_008132 [Malus domestica]